MGKIIGYYAMPHPPIAVPEVGRGEEKKISKTLEAMDRVSQDIKDLSPDIVIIITPHGPMFRDAVAISNVSSISGSLEKFGAPHVKFEIDINMDLVEKVIRYADEEKITIAPITKESYTQYNVKCELDHGSTVPLYFINKHYKDYKLLHITYGMLSKIDLYRFGMAIRKAVEDGDQSAVVVASGDLSHKLSDEGPYGYNPMGEKFDKKILKLLEEGDTQGIFTLDRALIEEAGECGLRSYYILLGILDEYDIKGEILSYEGTFGVGYGVMQFQAVKNQGKKLLPELIKLREEEINSKRKSESLYVKLARESLEHYVKNGEYLSMPEYIPNGMLQTKRGTFVSLKMDGELRGCIGTVFPTTDNVAQEIIRNAVEAGERDPRFFPVEEEELGEIEYSVDELMPPVKANREELDPKRYGVIVRSRGKSGLLLPDLEGVDTIDQQLSIALNKAGINKNEEYTIEKFEVIRHR